MEVHSYLYEATSPPPFPSMYLLEPVKLDCYPLAPSSALPYLISTVPKGTSLHSQNDAHNHNYSNNNHYHHLLGAQCVPGYFILTRTLGGKELFYCPHLTDRETEAPRSYLA